MTDIHDTTDAEAVATSSCSANDAEAEEVSRISALVQILHRKTQQEKSDAYAELVKMITEGSGKNEMVSYMKENVLPISLNDISTMKVDTEMDAAFEFLGNFLQASKLEIGEAEDVIETLTEKITKTTLKLESNKAMWCLANVQYHEDTPFSELEKILKSSLLYLTEVPPIPSMSTTYEAINVLSHLFTRSPKFLESKLADVLKLTFPMLFHESCKIRKLVLNFLTPLSSFIHEKGLLDEEYQNSYQEKYHLTLLAWISDDSMEGILVWRFLIVSFGCILHRNNSLLNDLLKAEEFALKSDCVAFRLVALDSWRWLIDCFARDPTLLLKPKRLRLIMTPFTLSESKTRQLAKKKIELWWHLLDQLGPSAEDSFQDVTLILLKFCFGSQIKPQGVIDTYPQLFNLALSSLVGVLSSQKVNRNGKLEPSSPFINKTQFIKNGSELVKICLQVFMLVTKDNAPMMTSLFEAFVQCCSEGKPHSDWEIILTVQLSNLINGLMDFPSRKPSSSDFILDCFLRSMNNKVFRQAFLNNFTTFLRWPVEHENKFLAVPYNRVIEQLYQSGTDDTDCVMNFVKQIAQALEDIKTNARTLVFRLHAATLWSGFVQLLLGKVDHFKLVYMDLTLFYFPMSIVLDMRTRCESVWVTWMRYFHLMLKNDPMFLDRMRDKVTELYAHRSNEVTLVACILKLLIRTVFLYGLESFKGKIMNWIESWTVLWIRQHSNAKNEILGQKSYKILGDMISSFLKDSPEKVQGSFIDCVFNLLESTYPTTIVAAIQSEVKTHVLAETNLSCDHFFPGTSSECKPIAAADNEECIDPSLLDAVEDTLEWASLGVEESVELEEIDELDDFVGDLLLSVQTSTMEEVQNDSSTLPFPIQIPEDFVIKKEIVSPIKSNETPFKPVTHSQQKISTSPQRAVSSSKPRARTYNHDKDFEPPKKVECSENVRRSSRPPKPAPWRLELDKKSPLAVTADDRTKRLNTFNVDEIFPVTSIKEQVAKPTSRPVSDELNPSTQELIANDVQLQKRVCVVIDRLVNYT